MKNIERVREGKVLGHSLIVTRKRTEQERRRVANEEILKENREFAVNIGLYEKYMYVYMYMYVYIAESCNKKRKQVTSHGTSEEQYMHIYFTLTYCAFYSLNYM